MTPGHAPVEPCATGVRLHLLVQPRASRSALAGLHDGRLRVRLTSPPVDGAANDALIRFLAGRLRVGRSAVTIASGQSGRRKTVIIAGITPGEAAERLGL